MSTRAVIPNTENALNNLVRIQRILRGVENGVAIEVSIATSPENYQWLDYAFIHNMKKQLEEALLTVNSILEEVVLPGPLLTNTNNS